MTPLPSLSTFFLKNKSEHQESAHTNFSLLQSNILSSRNIPSSSIASHIIGTHRIRSASAPESFLTRNYFQNNLIFHSIKDSSNLNQTNGPIEENDALPERNTKRFLARRTITPSSMSSHSSPSTHSFISSRTSTIHGFSINSRFSSSIPISGSHLSPSFSLRSVSTSQQNNLNNYNQPPRDLLLRPFSTPQPSKKGYSVPQTPISVSSSIISSPRTTPRFQNDLHYRPYFGSPPPACMNRAGFFRSPTRSESFASASSRLMDMEMLDFQRLLLLHQYRANQFELQLEDCKLTLDSLLSIHPSTNISQSIEPTDQNPTLAINPRSGTILLRQQVDNLQQQVHWLNIALSNYQSNTFDSSIYSQSSSLATQEIQDGSALNRLMDDSSIKDSSFFTVRTERKQLSLSSSSGIQNEPVSEFENSSCPSISSPESSSSLPKTNVANFSSPTMEEELKEQINRLEKKMESDKKTSQETEYVLNLELAEMHRHRELLLLQLNDLEKQLHEFQLNIFGRPHEEYQASSTNPNFKKSDSPFSLLKSLAPSIIAAENRQKLVSNLNPLHKNKKSIIPSCKKNPTLGWRKHFRMNLEKNVNKDLLRRLQKKTAIHRVAESRANVYKSQLTEKENHIQQLTAQNLNLMKNSAHMSLEMANKSKSNILQKDSVSGNQEPYNLNTNLNQEMTKYQKENLQLKAEMLQLEHLLDDLRIQHDQLVKELSKLHPQATKVTIENKRLLDRERELSEKLLHLNEKEYEEVNSFKHLLGSMFGINGSNLTWSSLITSMRRLEGLTQLMLSLEIQTPLKASSSQQDTYKKSLIHQLECVTAKHQTYMKLLGNWESQLHHFILELGISDSVLQTGSAPQDYVRILRTWYSSRRQDQVDMIENINSKNSSELVSHPEQILDLDITILKEFFENLPMEQLHTISKAFQKHPNVISHLRNVSNLLTKVRFYFGESSIEKIESELKSNMKVINQFSSISNLFNLPMDKIGDKLQRFFICILAGLNHPQNTAYNIDEIQNFILNLSKSQASLDFIYESQKSLLKSPISSEVDIHAKVIESIALSGKLKQQLRIVFMKWKQSEIKLKELEVINETTPSFISLQKAWKEVVKGVGCQLTEDPQIVAKSLVQNLYNANSNLLQLSEQVNQANMKTDAIEWSYQEFRKRCKDVLRILSDSESDILQSIVDMQEDLRMKSKIDPSEHHLMKKLWDNFNRDFSSILNEEPLDASFSIEDQYKYWLHSIQCHLLARQQSSLNLVVLQKLHQSICQKIEVLGKQLPIKKLDLNNPSNILDEVAKNLLEFEKLSYRLSNLHQLVLPEMCNVDLNTKLDTIEKYLQELRNYREKYYQKRSNVSRMYPEKLGIPNLKELIGKVATMPLITWKDSLSLKDPTYSAPMASLEKILNDTLGQTEKAINHYFNQLNKAEVKISAHINNSNLQQDNKNENEKKNLSSTLHDVHELGNVLEEALSMKEFTLENFERQRMLLLVKLKEYLKAITDSQCQAFVQLQANHEAESHKLKLDYGIQLNEKERDLRRLKKEISLLKNQLQALFNSKDTQAYSKALSTVLSKTLQTLDRV